MTALIISLSSIVILGRRRRGPSRLCSRRHKAEAGRTHLQFGMMRDRSASPVVKHRAARGWRELSDYTAATSRGTAPTNVDPTASNKARALEASTDRHSMHELHRSCGRPTRCTAAPRRSSARFLISYRVPVGMRPLVIVAASDDHLISDDPSAPDTKP